MPPKKSLAAKAGTLPQAWHMTEDHFANSVNEFLQEFMTTFLLTIYISGVLTVLGVTYYHQWEDGQELEDWVVGVPVALTWPLFIPMFIQIYLKK